MHSPLVGPSTWRWAAEALHARGHEALIPDLREAAVSGDPRAVVRAARPPRSSEPTVVVGHSGAGFYLPSVAAELGVPVHALVFVDAGLPPCDGNATAGTGVLDKLTELARDGTLPKWSTWWDAGVMESLVPDAARRGLIEAELCEIPLALYESSIRQPAGWCDGTAGYLLSSDAYRRDAHRARSLGWPVIEELGNHLDIVNDPESIARHLVELAQ